MTVTALVSRYISEILLDSSKYLKRILTSSGARSISNGSMGRIASTHVSSDMNEFFGSHEDMTSKWTDNHGLGGE